jgi:hypothetical protein
MQQETHSMRLYGRTANFGAHGKVTGYEGENIYDSDALLVDNFVFLYSG